MRSKISVQTTKEHQISGEIEEARKEIIAIFTKSLIAQGDIGMKRMGELDEKPFLNVCKQRYFADKAMVEAFTLCYTWLENIKDTLLNPFKFERTGDTFKEVVDEEDEKLKKLKRKWGEEVHNAVKTALEEMNDYNPCGWYTFSELWNFKNRRKTTLKEALAFISNNIKV